MSIKDRTIHFFDYMNYNYLHELSTTFDLENPVKNANNIYFSKLNNPIYFYLPKSVIKDIYEDNHDIRKIKYVIDLEEHSELLEFLDNLDTLTISIASNKSDEWFNRKVNNDILHKMIDNIYKYDDVKEEVYINIDLKDYSLMDHIKSYNTNSTNILVKIDSIEFYKKTFRLKLLLENLIEIDRDEFDKEENINFNNILDKEDRLENKINNEIINDLADIKNSTESLKELETLITSKKLEQKKYLINAERAKKAFNNLSNKAKDTESEISLISDKIKNKIINNSVISNI